MLSKKHLFLVTVAVSLPSACVDSTGPTDVPHIIGSGNLTSKTVPVDSFHAAGSGVMSVVVNVSDELKGDVCGVGTIQYVGAPEVFVTTCPAVSVSQLPSG